MTTITIDRAVVEQALEALEKYRQMMFAEAGCRWDGGDAAITALRAALAQQENPKPMSPEQRQRWEELAAMPQQAEPLNLADPAVRKRLATQWGYVPAAQAEPVEPVAWNWMLDGLPYGRACYGDPPDADIAKRAATAGRTVRLLYTAPPQRKPLTEEVAALIAQRDALLAEHQQTLALQQRSYEREIQLEVEAEREACAKLCEDYDDDRGTGETWGPRFAAIIRARAP